MRSALAFLLISVAVLADPYGHEFRRALEPSLHGPELCAKGGLAGRAPRAGDDQWDVLHVDLELAPLFNAERLEGSVAFRALVTVGPLERVLLDFRDEMDVTSLALNGAPVLWTHASHIVSVQPMPPLAEGEEFLLEIEFEGAPPSLGWGSFEWYEHEGVMSVATLSEPENARGWWPSKDVPDDKFTLDVRYRVPQGFKAPGPGLLQSVTDNGDLTETWHWRESYPICTYLVAMTVTNFIDWTDWYVDEEGDSLPIENFVWPETWNGAQEDLSIAPEAAALLESLCGEYPFKDEKYGHAIFQWPGGMEHQTMTSYGFYLVGGHHYFDRILVHEMAHSWFGNCVTLQDWENVWINEGPAKYSEALWFEHRDGPEGLRWFMDIIDVDFTGPVYNNPNLFGPEVYQKGAWVLHMLRGAMRDDALFFAALRDYLSRHAYGNAHTTDLQADLESFLGLDLEPFFQQWVYGVGRPDYRWGWQRDGDRLLLRVDQVQADAGLFVMPLHFRAHAAGDSMDFHVENAQWSELWSLPLDGFEPEQLVFDPELWLLKHAEEVPYDPTGAEGTPAWSTALRGNYPNPFNPTTRVAFTLERRGPVRLSVHEPSGRRVAVILEGVLDEGPHDLAFDGRDRSGGPLPSGVYLLSLETESTRLSRRMVLIK